LEIRRKITLFSVLSEDNEEKIEKMKNYGKYRSFFGLEIFLNFFFEKVNFSEVFNDFFNFF